VAPEDKRYGQDVLIPKGATGAAKPGQVVVVELTEPPALFGQPVGRIKEVLGEIDDPAWRSKSRCASTACRTSFPTPACAGPCAARQGARQDKLHRVDLTDVPLVTIDGEDARDFDDAVYCEPAKIGKGRASGKGWRLLVAIADVSHYVETGSGHRHRRLRPRHQRVFSAPRDPDAAREAVQRPVFAQPRGRAPVHGVRHAGVAKGEVTAYQFYPAVMFSHARFTYTEVAAILANTRGPEAIKRKDRVGPAQPARRVPRVAQAAQRAARWTSKPPKPRSSATKRPHRENRAAHPQRRPQADRRSHAGGQCLQRRLHRAEQAPGLYRVHEGPRPRRRRSCATTSRPPVWA
jgi:ribonuclease R